MPVSETVSRALADSSFSFRISILVFGIYLISLGLADGSV